MNSKITNFLQLNSKTKQQFAIFFLLIFLSSCLSHREMINFRSGEEKVPTLKNLSKQDILNKAEIKLQPNDVLGIIITSPDGGLLSAPYNIAPSQINGQNLTPTSPSSFIVNSEGNIELPNLGTIKASGMSVKELKDTVVNRVSKFLESPSVNIRLINFKVSVIGEVTRPETIQVDNERITILEAIARVGDCTPYSDRKHIMIIREHNGTREFGEIDLKDNKFFDSPYYYLQQNDVVYVEPVKGKIAQIQQPINTYLQPVQVGISVIAILVALLKK
jgi:polysaccharide biosynthesis/export protein